MTTLIKDPSPGGPTTDGSTIFTDQHNALVDRLGGETALTANRALNTNASGNIEVSTVTEAELDFLSGVTSAIQTQLDTKSELEWVNVKDHGATGDGVTDDTAAIHAAMVAAGTNGVVFVPSGTYVCQLEIIEAGLTLRGNGKESIIKAPAISVGAQPAPIDIFADGVIIQDLQIDGNRANSSLFEEHLDCVTIYSNRVTVQNCDIINHIAHGVIGWDDARTGTRGSAAAGVRYGCRVLNNTFRTPTPNAGIIHASAIDFADGSPSGTTPINEANIIANNTLIGPTDNAGHGITFHTSMRGIITGNVLKDWNWRGISVHTNSEETIVSNNVIEGSSETALRVQATCKKCIVDGNIILDGTGDGIHLGGTNIICTNNIVQNHTFSSIQFQGTNLIISNNIVNGGNSTDQCVKSDGTLTDVIFSNNIVDGNNTFNTISISHATVNSSFTNNRIKNSGVRGLYLTGQMTDVLVENNIIEGGSGTGFETTHASTTRLALVGNDITSSNAVNIAAGSVITISDNNIHDTGSNSVLISTSDVTFKNNVIDTSSSNGLVVSANDVEIFGNFITGTTGDGINVSGAITGIRVFDNRFTSITGSPVGGTLTGVIHRSNVGWTSGEGMEMAGDLDMAGNNIINTGTLTLPTSTDTLVGRATTDTLTNKTFDANGTGNSLSNVDVADLATGTDGELITWDAAGNPATVAVGTSGHVLTSNGAGAAPTFQANPAGFADPMTTRGDIIIRDATNTTARLAIGANTFVLTSDGTDVSWASPSAASQTPWTQDINADTFALTWNSVDAAVPAGTVEYITNVTAGLVSNVATGLVHDFHVNNVSQMTISASTIDFQSNTLTDITDITSITSLNGVAIGNYILTTDSSTSLADTADIAYLNTANTFIAGNKQTISQSASTAGLNLGAVSAAPSTPAEGDVWYQGSSDELAYRDVAATRILANLDGTQALTNKTINTASNTITINEADISDLGTSAALVSDNLSVFAATTSAQLAGVISDETGSGALVFATSPTLVTPALGTPSALVLTNATGLPVSGLANGTDGELITWSATGTPTTVAVGTAGQVLTSNGVGAAPTFQAAGAADNLGDHTATQDLVMGTNAITFGIDAAAPAASTTYITTLAAGPQYNAITGDIHDFLVNGVSQMTISDTTIDFQANTLTDITDITSITSLNGVAIGSYALATGDTFTGVHDFGGATSLEIPNGAAPTVNAAGEIAVDTTITDYTGLIKYHDGTEELTVVAMPTANLSTTDSYAVVYNAANNEFTMAAQSGGGSGGGWNLLAHSKLGSDLDNITPTWTGSEKQILNIHVKLLPTGTVRPELRLGDGSIDTGTNYEYSVVENAVKTENLTANTIILSSTYANYESMTFDIVIYNTTDGRKIIIWTGGVNDESTDAVAINGYAVWKNTAANVDRVDVFNSSTGDFLTNSEVEVLGRDFNESAGGGGLSNVVEDTTPQLGGQLDVNGNAIGDGTLELLTFTETASAVNQINITNAATTGAPKITAAGDDTNIDLELVAKGTGNVNVTTGKVQESGTNISPIGIHDIFIPASAMWPTTTAGCADLAKTELATNDINIQTLDFDTTTAENAQFSWIPPRNFNNGTITITPYWTAASGSGTVKWDIKAVAISNDDPLDAAFGTLQGSTDTLLLADDLHVGPATSALTIGGTPADSDLIQFNIARDVATDTLGVDAKLIGVVIHFSIDAATAA